VLAAAAATAHAGSTGSTQLFTPNGGAAVTANGDYLTSTAGMNTFYRYFVEVPPGLSRLRIQLFDADFGQGGTTEANAGRDRARTAFAGTSTYSLIDPSGAARTTLFTTGSATLPAGGDNAWLSLFDANPEAVRDNFATAAYTNNDGSFSFAGNWIETNDDGNPGTGLIRIIGGELSIQDNGGGASSVEREANLSGRSSATLSFSFRTASGVDAGDQMAVQVSGNGGATWSTLETFTGVFASTTRSYNISSSIATNTRVRFLEVGGYTGTESFLVDNFQISTPVPNGHWEVRIAMSSETGADDINAIGIRADDGDATSGGTELPVYIDSIADYGVNTPPDPSTRSYTVFPYITSHCTCSKNDFDYDTNSGNAASMSVSSRTGAFTQSFASTSMSTDNTWRRDTINRWTTDTAATDYGVWSSNITVNTYNNGAANANYGDIYFANPTAAANPPTANPVPNAFRTYLASDAGNAPVKPYLEQLLTHVSGPNPPAVGQTSTVAVTVRLVNPTARPIVFSAANLVTSNIPGAGAVYAGSAAVGQGSIVSQPAVGGTGNLTWNPGTLAAGATAILTYRVNVTPTSAGQRIPVTATPASGNGTRAQWLDETGNSTQTRATYLFGPLCELAITQGLLTKAVVSFFDVSRESGRSLVEWETTSEAGTLAFNLLRRDEAGERWVRVNERPLLALLSAPQGGHYRLLDPDGEPGASYLLEELEGRERTLHGPYSGRFGRPQAAPGGLARRLDGFDRAPHPRPEAAPATPVPDARPASAVAIGVRDAGWTEVPLADLAPLLGTPASRLGSLARVGGLRLTRHGQAVAWTLDPAASALGFLGEAPAGLYARESVYLLEVAPGLRMANAALGAAPATPPSSFLDRLHAEHDLLPAVVLPLDPASDYWFWDYLLAGDPGAGSRSFALDVTDLAAGPGARLTVRLQGATDSGLAGEHHVVVKLGGVPLGELRFQGIASQTASFAVPEGVLREGGNEVRLESVLEDVPLGVVFVDAFDLDYPRLRRARQGTLRFTARPGEAVTIPGFGKGEVRLLEIGDPKRPRLVTGLVQEPDPAGGTRLRFLAPPEESAYLAFAPRAVHAPAFLRPAERGLRDSREGADYLVVTARALRPAADRLAAHRAGQGLTTRVVEMEDVGDAFGDGIASPLALQAFLRHVRERWQPLPHYVVLAGGGHFDYRGLLDSGPNPVPPLLVRTPKGLFASDSALADLDGSGRPGFALGRIPARTSEELSAYVDKLERYEQTAAEAALVATDRNDRNVSFRDDAAGLWAGLPIAEHVDLEDRPIEPARQALFGALAEGRSLLAYVGHGSLDRLSAEGLLTSADVPDLTNRDHLPVLVSLSCVVNRFEVPGFPPLGSALVLHPDGGAIASWSPTGVVAHHQSSQLAATFFRAATTPGAPPLGDLTLAALRAATPGEFPTYTLLGDPALRLRLLEPRPLEPVPCPSCPPE
jgi:hypothetical protein